MKILVTGAAGMLGRKLVAVLAAAGKLAGTPITSVTRLDSVLAPAPPEASFPIDTHISNLATQASAEKAIAGRPDVIFHLAAVVSAEAEANMDLGYEVNLDGTRFLLEAIRHAGQDYAPRFVFTSSIAVFGAPFPETIPDNFLSAPLTSYGTQKAICELLISDYSRRDILDGMSLRMPTVCVRPGAPNKAASGFFSNIIREPLIGKEAILPVSEEVRHWHVSPRRAVAFLVYAAELGGAALGVRRALTLPGVSCTVGEQIAALRDVAGERATRLIKRQPDGMIGRIVAGWPQKFDARRAIELGFEADNSFAEIIRVHIDDELGGKLPA